MSRKPVEKTDDTVRLLRPPPRVFTDSVGRNVWMGDIEIIDLDLEQTPATDPYNSVKTDDPWSGV